MGTLFCPWSQGIRGIGIVATKLIFSPVRDNNDIHCFGIKIEPTTEQKNPLFRHHKH